MADAALGANAVRLYEVPDRAFLDRCAAAGLRAWITIPWEQHVDFLRDRRLAGAVEDRVARAAGSLAGHPAVLGYLVGNEILERHRPLDRTGAPRGGIFGAARRAGEGCRPRRAGRLRELSADRIPARAQCGPCAFNVYLEDRAAFRRYAARLQNLGFYDLGRSPSRSSAAIPARNTAGQADAGLGAGGMPRRRHGGRGGLRARFVAPGGEDDWLGLRRHRPGGRGEACRRRRARRLHRLGIAVAAPDAPMISALVCTRNGAATLPDCLKALAAQRYPRFEVIVVDDGSTDGTGAVAARFSRRACATCGMIPAG
ncbi:MAG: glycosyltransferase [Verrucomicrobiales bacterium]